MSEVKVNKISPRSGTDVTLGDASDTFTIPASATLDVNGTIDVTGSTVTGLSATDISSGTLGTARLGTGSASSSTFLRGDNAWEAAGGGKVLQVLQTVKTDVFSSSSVNDTWSAITGLSVAITPSLSTSKILVQYNVNVSMASGDHSGVATGIYRDGTLISGAKASSLESTQEAVTTVTTHYNEGDSNSGQGVASMMYLDSPSTTSETTYQVYLFNASGSAFVSYVNRTESDGDYAYVTRGVSSITVMEIGA